MRLPIRYIAGNLLWSRYGSVWAVWRVEPAPYRNASRTAKHELLYATEAMLKTLVGEPMLLSLCGQLDAVDVVRRMVSGVDLEASPEWVMVCDAVLDQLDAMALTERSYWLAAPLPNLTSQRGLRAILDSAQGNLTGMFGLAAPPPSAAEVGARADQAAKLASTLPGGLKLHPASSAELLWMYMRAPLRGLDEPPLDAASKRREAARNDPNLTALDEVFFDEGGKTERSGLSLFNRRFLRVETEQGVSYQAFLALADMPSAFAFPGSEWLAHLDNFGFPIDWVSRLKIVPGREAEAKSRRQARELAHQVEEYDGEAAGVPAALQDARYDLDEYRARLTANASEVELRATTAFCVYSHELEQCEARAEVLRNAFGSNQYQIVRPIDGQLALYEAMLPGGSAGRVVSDYAQFQPARDFAMATPFAATDVGDPQGGLLGFILDGSGVRPVLWDPSYGPQINASASSGFVGELGAGKSVALKKAWWETIAPRRPGPDGMPRAGRVLCVDRTPIEEFVTFAKACPGVTEIIQVDATANLTLDPLRIFRLPTAARYAESFLTLLLGTMPLELEGVLLSEAVTAVAGRPNPSISRVIDELEARSNADSLARDLARKLRAVAGKDLARIVFDETLPPLRISDADSIVFATASLRLPKREELVSEYFSKRLELEKVFGRAVLYLIAAICREVAFSDISRFTAVIWDECWWLTSSAEGQELLLELIRDGRKHNAGAFVGSHDPDDFGNEIIRGLLSSRFLLRQRDKTLAAKGLRFLGLDAGDPDLLHLVTKNLSPLDVPEADRELRAGECLFRDVRSRVGKVKIIIPPLPEVMEAILTTPPVAAADPALENGRAPELQRGGRPSLARGRT